MPSFSATAISFIIFLLIFGLGIPSTTSCPVKCFRTDPVCGVDGVIYWCGYADAHCAGTRVAKPGFCQVGSGSISGQAFLLVHSLWLVAVGISVVFGLL